MSNHAAVIVSAQVVGAKIMSAQHLVQTVTRVIKTKIVKALCANMASAKKFYLILIRRSRIMKIIAGQVERHVAVIKDAQVNLV